MLPLKLILFNRSLDSGGAERQMVNLAIGLKERGVDVVVVVFYGNGVFKADLLRSGVSLIELNKRSRWDIFLPMFRFYQFVKSFRPNCIYSFIGVEIFSFVGKVASRNTALVWGVRASLKNMDGLPFLDKLYYSFKPLLSRFVDGVISNSEAGRIFAIDRGYDSRYFYVVDNGIDVDKFVFSSSDRSKLRSDWKVGNGVTLVGMVARVVRDKDYECFIRSISIVQERLREKTPLFVIVGDGDSEYIADLIQLSEDLSVSHLLIWAGYHSNVSAVYSALDVYCLASKGEGFPNTVAEAMSCGLPVVVSDVGDCRRIVGAYGTVVDIGSPDALAEGLIAYSGISHGATRDEIRGYVVQNFSVERMVDRSVNTIQEICSK